MPEAIETGEGKTAARILVVDDEPDVEALVRQTFRRQIRRGELEFVFASDGQDAVEAIGRDPDIDMVITDINMPRMNGLELLEKLSDDAEHLKAVIVSAYGDMTNIRSAMNLGAFDFVTKPIEFGDLERTIAKTLKHVRGIRTLQEERDQALKAQSILARHFSPTIAEALARMTDERRALVGERREATFLFTDLAGFTALVETAPSDEVVELLNTYLANITRIVFEHRGTVMKIIGDAVHAAFGAPLDDPDHARAAVECAVAIDRFATEFSGTSELGVGHTRVGVNSGPAMIGNFGGDDFFDYSAYGDAVNVAARLEAANKGLGTRVCVSRMTAERVADFTGRPIGDLALRGRSVAIRAFEPGPPDPDYEAAFALLEGGDPQARQGFARLVSERENDALAAFHLGRILQGELDVRIDPDGR